VSVWPNGWHARNKLEEYLDGGLLFRGFARLKYDVRRPD